MIEDGVLRNFVNGRWTESSTTSYQEVLEPGDGRSAGAVPLSTPAEVDHAATVALAAFDAWRRTPAPARIQYLFKLKNLLEAHFDDLARTITQENGKIVDEAAGELRRAIENVEVACGIPTMMLGDFSEDIARGVDEYMIRQPVGVAAIICALQLPRHDPLLVSALRAGLRQHGDRQAIGALPDHDAEGVPPARTRPASRRAW